ncbi:MAG: hypothetical protein WCI94_13675 [Rhodospirillales bacterium]
MATTEPAGILPIVLEIDPWPAALCGLVAIAVSLYAIRQLRRSYRDKGLQPAHFSSGALVACLIALGIGIGVERLGWRFRLDDHGVVLSAPFDVLRPGGSIAWENVVSVKVVGTSYRGGMSYKLRIEGADGTEIVLSNADRLPKQLMPLLMKLLIEHTPEARRDRFRLQDFETADLEVQGWALGDYTARNGAGTILR